MGLGGGQRVRSAAAGGQCAVGRGGGHLVLAELHAQPGGHAVQLGDRTRTSLGAPGVGERVSEGEVAGQRAGETVVAAGGEVASRGVEGRADRGRGRIWGGQDWGIAVEEDVFQTGQARP